MVGPGIGRGEYGGFLMIAAAAAHVRCLARSGLRFRREQVRAPAAGRPGLFDPALRGLRGGQAAALGFPNIAARIGRTIVYIPIGQLSPVTLKKIRVVHVLDGYDKRKIAKEYIW